MNKTKLIHFVEDVSQVNLYFNPKFVIGLTEITPNVTAIALQDVDGVVKVKGKIDNVANLLMGKGTI